MAALADRDDARVGAGEAVHQRARRERTHHRGRREHVAPAGAGGRRGQAGEHTGGQYGCQNGFEHVVS
jgi:hypothetical protein